MKKSLSLKNGIKEFILDDWNDFHDLIISDITRKNYVYRGQKDEKWKLEPTLHRNLKSLSEDKFIIQKNKLLESFKISLRGKTNYYKDVINEENELWAIGQHNFLHTPLLDFTLSPYVAAYFAFYEEEYHGEYRIIYAISQKNIIENHDDALEVFKPTTDYNNRLINQSGLFVNFKSKNDIETLVTKKYALNKDGKIKMYKIKIKNDQRQKCLISLNKMNINHNTLFPDLYGAALYCNLGLQINNY